ncbi:hypothetical protein COW91_01280 [Candidatus Nomurabacteria bacterium CG22_combo_CG10-13_8_21_14_all_32_8]|uniref:Uncharacterized protein n=1 Tax=Candidatus Nomurabacteria bacterium CG22_combo_CG10-13_8_21_14_all_32_8 TaxID=1974732 RepID=A0A2H0CGS1_9BACT|nr:MAG: hypothetical protein COW91_01280 [Candidatus Nomurabacteria bacterium CG22_combo_CG10-13_8_21_14_all_32_8]
MVNEPSGRDPETIIEVIANKIKSLEDSVKSIKEQSKLIITLVVSGFIFLLIMVAAILYDSLGLKNDLSQERYQLLKEQINSKCK